MKDNFVCWIDSIPEICLERDCDDCKFTGYCRFCINYNYETCEECIHNPKK